MAEWKIKEITAQDVWELPGKVVKVYRVVASSEGYPDVVFELPIAKMQPTLLDAMMREKAREMEQLITRKVRV